MLRGTLLLISLVLAALGSLTWFPAPTLTGWQCAILAGEYGQWLMAGPLLLLVVGLVRWGRGARGMPEAAGLGLALWALVGFVHPTVSAWTIARALPERAVAAFGPKARIDRAPLSLGRYVCADALVGTAETFTYAEGAAPLALDFYRAGGSIPAPCLVLIHGGGWDSGRRDELTQSDRFFVAQGYAVAAIDYRLAPQHPWPAQKQDVRAALAYLKGHAAALGIDPTRLVLFGRSAGGQIAVACGYELLDPSIRGVIAFYAPHDLRFAWAYAKPDDVLNSAKLLRQYTGGTPEEAPAAYDDASGYFHVTSRAPPTLLVHGALDTLVWHRQSERLEAMLAKAGVPHLFVSLPWATHAFDYHLDGPGGQIGLYATLAFLKAETQ